MDDELTDALRRMDTGTFTSLARNRKGYRPLIDCALDYAREGITSLEEVVRLAGGLDELLDSQMDPHALDDGAS
jgi:MSHA biogenesis protein MshE